MKEFLAKYNTILHFIYKKRKNAQSFEKNLAFLKKCVKLKA